MRFELIPGLTVAAVVIPKAQPNIAAFMVVAMMNFSNDEVMMVVLRRDIGSRFYEHNNLLPKEVL